MNDLDTKILLFIQNRHEKGESTSSRNIHIRFGNEMCEIEIILNKLFEKNWISKYYDSQYQEERYIPKNSVRE